MRASIPHPPRKRFRRRSLPATLLVLACVMAGQAGASSFASFDAESHAKSCKCGPKCRGASCCCGTPDRSEAPRKPTPPAAGTSHGVLADSPCLNSSPCQDPLLPPSTPVGAAEKAEASRPIARPPALVGRRLAPSRSSHLPTDRRASRLDRPPKAPASA